jgi:hypothetical protein
MARSRRRRGLKMPGVSTRMIWVWPVMATPRTGKRVVWTFWVTIETLAPTMRLTRVDLPAFGAPMMAANPARVVWPGCFGRWFQSLRVRVAQRGRDSSP